MEVPSASDPQSARATGTRDRALAMGARDLIAAGRAAPSPAVLVQMVGAPSTVAEWRALADGLLTNQSCVFHRNLEISSGYAWMYKSAPAYFKWAGMAAFASHHARLVLYPYRLRTDGSGYADLVGTVEHNGIPLLADLNTIRSTNNDIFDDIYWAHLAYAADESGMDRLRDLLQGDDTAAPLLAGFEAIDEGRHILEAPDATAADRHHATKRIWDGNLQLLDHEQRAIVQPNFDRLSRTFGGLFSAGSSLSFEARGLRQQAAYFSSFYLYSFGSGFSAVLRSRRWPRVTSFDDRWRWIVAAVVPRFKRLEADTGAVDARLHHIFLEARAGATSLCTQPALPRVADR